jgi:hypothetical protein
MIAGSGMEVCGLKSVSVFCRDWGRALDVS